MQDSHISPATTDEANRRADIQYAVARVLSDARTVDEAVHALLRALSEALRWDYGGLWLPAADGQHLDCVDTWTTGDEGVVKFAQASREWRFERGRGLPGQAWAMGKAIWLAGVAPDPTLPRVAVARAANLFGGLAFPIVNARGVVGIVECFTKERETVTPELLRFTESIGRQIGQFLQRRAIEQQLEENEARYAAIVNGALDGIVVIDEQGRVLEFNRAAEQMFGYSRQDAIGRDMAELIIPSYLRARHHKGLRRVVEYGESPLFERRLELTACRSDGTELPVELTITRMNIRGRWSFLGFLRDISERQQHERERQALLVRERAAYEDAQAANALKDEFLAALSHELRTPLNAVLGWSDMLVRGAIDPERFRSVADTIRRNALVQQRLVEDMLDLSAFVSGRARLAAERMTIDVPLQAASDVVKPAAFAKRVRLHVAAPPVVVRGDSTRLQQVFWNLLSNAVKFTPVEGSVTAQATVADGHVTTTVTDTGEGIDPAMLPFVFDRFRQGRNARNRGGLGLGLAIVKQIVEAHGGTVTAASEGPGQGASFSVRLPLAE